MKQTGINLQPKIFVDSPSDRSQLLANTTVLISGHVNAASPVAPIASVFVNGVAVDALDAGGAFFARVQLSSGIQIFSFTAEDVLGGKATTEISLEGIRQSTQTPDLLTLSDVSKLRTSYGVTSWNKKQELLFADLYLKNIGNYSVHTPLIVGIKNISDSSVIPRDVDGVTAEGIPYYNFSSSVVDGTLSPGEQSTASTMTFYNPGRLPFKYDLVLLGQLNRPPFFTTAPKTSAIVGTNYSYSFHASDPDGDTLQYSLLAAPQGMTILAGDRLNWQPTSNDIGNHLVVLKARDGFGGGCQTDCSVRSRFRSGWHALFRRDGKRRTAAKTGREG